MNDANDDNDDMDGNNHIKIPTSKSGQKGPKPWTRRTQLKLWKWEKENCPKEMEMNKEVKLQKPLELVERRSQMTAIYAAASNQTWTKYNKSPCLKPGTLTFYNRIHQE